MSPIPIPETSTIRYTITVETRNGPTIAACFSSHADAKVVESAAAYISMVNCADCRACDDKAESTIDKEVSHA